FSSIPTETNSRCGSGCIEKTMKNFVVVASPKDPSEFLLFTWFCVTSVTNKNYATRPGHAKNNKF
ncbi:MAG: hypothetical protein KJ666_13635, partial [Bacteroidetes bacterium]|nr:hypothetical protein [Bacteroidota bacterium]